MKRLIASIAFGLCTAVFAPSGVLAAQSVTVDTFVRAETDETFRRYVKQGGFGKFAHVRVPTPIEQQGVIRMNRDTLYSAAVLDLTSPATIIKPDSKGRFQSMLIINQDHSMQPVIHGHGEFKLTREKIGTRYALVLIRTFADAKSADDINAANALQDMIQIRQANPGSFDVPEWDHASLGKLRDAINVLASTLHEGEDLFGDKKKLNPILHLLGTAYGWGGNPRSAAIYVNAVPTQNDGVTPYVLTVKDVPVDGFWSVTVYNEKGFMEKNDLDAYSFNNVTAKRNPDGSVSIHFGGDPKQPNYLPITKGWNYIARLYQPRKALLKGQWAFPVAQPVK